MVSYQCSVETKSEERTVSKNTVTLKPGLGSLKVMNMTLFDT